jgi:hypothetical protein
MLASALCALVLDLLRPGLVTNVIFMFSILKGREIIWRFVLYLIFKKDCNFHCVQIFFFLNLNVLRNLERNHFSRWFVLVDFYLKNDNFSLNRSLYSEYYCCNERKSLTESVCTMEDISSSTERKFEIMKQQLFCKAVLRQQKKENYELTKFTK